MVRTVQLEKDLRLYVDGLLQQRLTAEVGVLVGNLTSGPRSFVLLLAKSPQQAGAEPVSVKTLGSSGKKSGGKTAAAAVEVALDTDWLTVHAHNVSRMLPGGLSVAGIYLFCPEAGVAGATGQVINILTAIASSSNTQGKAAKNMLFLHMASDSRKLSLKELPLTASSGKTMPLRPCEIKHATIAKNLACVSCRLGVDMAVPVTSQQASLASLFGAAIQAESRRIRSGIAACGNRIPQDDQLLGDAVTTTRQQGEQGAGLAVELLCPPRCAAEPAAEQPSTADARGVTECMVFGLVEMHGTLEGRAYVHKRDTVADAVDALKEDLVASLRARLDLILLEEGEEPEAEGPLSRAAAGGAAICQPLPARVFFPVKGDVMLCDYLAPGETEADVVERCREMLALQLEQVLHPEAPAETQTPSNWEPLRPSSTASAPEQRPQLNKAAPSQPCSSTTLLVVGAAAAACLAAALGYMLS